MSFAFESNDWNEDVFSQGASFDGMFKAAESSSHDWLMEDEDLFEGVEVSAMGGDLDF